MKNILLVFLTLIAFSVNAITIQSASNAEAKLIENSEYINFSSLGGVYYEDEIENFILDFDFSNVDSVKINDSIFTVSSNELIVLSNLELGDYSIEVNDKSKSFKFKGTAPFFKKDTVVFGLLLIVLVVIFKTSEMKGFKRFYNIVPGLLLCYFIPAILNSLNIID